MAKRTPEPHPLPFVKDGIVMPDGPRRCFWHVEPTGDYERDCRTGEHFGLAFLEHHANSDGFGILGFIIRDMLAKVEPQDQSGIRVGFISVLGVALRHRVTSDYVKRLRAHFDAIETRDKELKAKLRRERSERCRRAALVGVERRRARARLQEAAHA